MQQECLEEPLRKVLPRDDGRPVEKPAEAGLRMRMYVLVELLADPSARRWHTNVSFEHLKTEGPSRRCVDEVRSEDLLCKLIKSLIFWALLN